MTRADNDCSVRSTQTVWDVVSGVGYYSITRPVDYRTDALVKKLLACRAARSFIRPLTSFGPAADAGIASTHHLPDEYGLRLLLSWARRGPEFCGTLPVQSFGAICSIHPVPAKACRVNCVVGVDNTTCGKLDVFAGRTGKSDKATADHIVGEENSWNRTRSVGDAGASSR